MTTNWTTLSPFASSELARARTQLHWAAQALAAAADQFMAPADDDSHTNLFWSARHRGLVGRPLPGDQRLALLFDDFALAHLEANEILDRRPLDGVSLAEALAWTQAKTRVASPLAVRDYEMPVHDGVFAAGAAMSTLGDAFEAATALFADFAHHESRASAVAVWPHHFDVGGIVFLEPPSEKAKQIGFGLSPGDSTIDEPYLYVTPWPIAKEPRFPALNEGAWQTKGFTGAVLRVSDLARDAEGQRDRAWAFLTSAMSGGEVLIETNGE